MTAADYTRHIDQRACAAGILSGDRAALARAITLIESRAPRHQAAAQALLTALLPHSGKSIRIGISGAPGAGKSTFIEALGTHLTANQHRVAVLAIDPSSTRSGGSILGDKTRMERLSRDARAFIRPSPTSGTLGGVADKTRESILLCEAAGYDVVLIETVGSGQNEITVRSMVDFFLLLMIAGSGDELQGIKKGAIEIADALLINKADGPGKIAAQAARTQFNRALHLLSPATAGWQTRAYTASALNGEGIPAIWQVIQEFIQHTQSAGIFKERRQTQRRDWLHSLLKTQLHALFLAQPAVQAALPQLETAVVRGDLSAAAAAQQLLALLFPPASNLPLAQPKDRAAD